MRTHALRSDRYVRWSQRSFCWRYCLMYKLYTLKVTKKQVYALIEHADSPYIRGVGFMFLRYTLPPQLMWDWFEPYLDDEEVSCGPLSMPSALCNLPGSLSSVVMIWYTCIVGFDAFPDGFIVGKSKVVEKSKVQFKSTKGQRQAWEETTYIGKTSSVKFWEIAAFFHISSPA